MVQLGIVVPSSLPEFPCNVSNIPNKIGGFPYWLYPCDPQLLKCQKCQELMPLLMQIYCPDDDVAEAFHRIVYVFCCPKNSCHSGNDGFLVLRAQLYEESDYYSQDGDWIGAVSHFCFCRLPGTKRCGSCSTAYYCSREHQVLDWPTHKQECKNLPGEQSKIFVWPEHEIEDEDEPDKDTWTSEQQSKFQVDTSITEEDKELEQEDETEVDVDKQFLKFEKRIAMCPSQVLRYARLGEEDSDPLFVSESGKPEFVPDCPHCKGKRTFEFQIMPQLLNYLKIDHKDPNALDWGTLLIYSCANHCEEANQRYTTEYLCVQKFSQAGMGDSMRKKLEERAKVEEETE
ncbi:programmed cell death protein 2 [Gorgonomyces haynaldii]|nr:programmed cell death protein 2 [Gorgonomyces haynaldii]